MANFLQLLMQVVPILGTAKLNAPFFVPEDNAGRDHVIITNWDWLDFRQGSSTSPAAILEKERPDPTNVRGLGTHRTAAMANFLQLLMQEQNALPDTLRQEALQALGPTFKPRVSDAHLRILAIDPRMPGSTHDSYVRSWVRQECVAGQLVRHNEYLL
ncbi:hypothetical protein HPB47_016189, partial [Ixodes persulcatus]